ncbi:hypothetical protein CASFOL_026955 [Castilleja foliolosa]|uniref:Uncharacterized protein n=1 Tax=Castilleja foliolosa TaxID=1961234 RepID=A0ABD3CJC7_9LAMI
MPIAYRKQLSPAMVTPLILPQKRPMPSPAVDESYFRRNYSAMAAAAAAAEDEGEEDDDMEGLGKKMMMWKVKWRVRWRGKMPHKHFGERKMPLQ